MTKQKTSGQQAATTQQDMTFVGLYRPKLRRRVTKAFPSETLTEQSHKAACDVNNIMARYTATGVMEHVRQFEPVYGDMTADDYHASLTAVAEAKSMFEELPSTLRRHFGDDVARFLEFCDTTPNASDELQSLAEGYRKQAMGIPDAPADDSNPPGREAGAEGGQDTVTDDRGEPEPEK